MSKKKNEETLCKDLNVLKIEPMNAGAYCFDEYETTTTYDELRQIAVYDHLCSCSVILYIGALIVENIKETITNKKDQKRIIEIVEAAARQKYKYIDIYCE